jgi:hypothetical protein
MNLGSGVNTGFNDTFPALSSDGMTLIFTSDRPGFGGSDLSMSSRAKAKEDVSMSLEVRPGGMPETAGRAATTYPGFQRRWESFNEGSKR